jgi:hypothetical protein
MWIVTSFVAAIHASSQGLGLPERGLARRSRRVPATRRGAWDDFDRAGEIFSIVRLRKRRQREEDKAYFQRMRAVERELGEGREEGSIASA